MRLLTAAILFAFLAAPASAQLHERGVARAGAPLATRTGGTAFMCQSACDITGGCAGWNWTRAGVDGPQARCELLSGALQSRPDSCCNSGQNGDPAAPVAVADSAALRGNQYVGRSQTPTGPPVQLTGDPTGGIWQDTLADEEADEDEDASEDDEDEEQLSPGEEDDARMAAAAAAEAPEVTTSAAPSARITANGRPRSGGAPRYSVLNEYGAAPAAEAAPAPPPATGTADPGRWIDG